ncbi:hypothetical protein IFM89_039551, partial [Coptis chinensis]
SLYPGFNSSVTNGFMPVDQFQIDATGKINQPFGLSFPYDPDPNGKNPSAFGVLPGSHALLNGKPSTRPVPDCLSPRNSGLLDALLH